MERRTRRARDRKMSQEIPRAFSCDVIQAMPFVIQQHLSRQKVNPEKHPKRKCRPRKEPERPSSIGRDVCNGHGITIDAVSPGYGLICFILYIRRDDDAGTCREIAELLTLVSCESRRTQFVVVSASMYSIRY